MLSGDELFLYAASAILLKKNNKKKKTMEERVVYNIFEKVKFLNFQINS